MLIVDRMVLAGEFTARKPQMQALVDADLDCTGAARVLVHLQKDLGLYLQECGLPKGRKVPVAVPLGSGNFVEDFANGDPVSRKQFADCAEYIGRNLFGKVPGQKEPVLSSSPFAPKIRFCSVYVYGLCRMVLRRSSARMVRRQARSYLHAEQRTRP